MKLYKLPNQSATNYEIRTDTFEGKEYLVVPVIMVVEGVHSGSHGPMLHRAADFGRYPSAWNGIPITVDHPTLNGESVSANSPQIIDSQVVGRVFNTHLRGERLMAEAWIEKDKTLRINAEVLDYINNRRPLDVSMGIFSDEEEVAGDWNGEPYEAIARNHRPDHLALLPGGVGACSWADGCGIRANEKKGGKNVKRVNGLLDVEVFEEEGKDSLTILKKFHEKGYYMSEIAVHVEKGFKELVQNAQQKLDRMDDDVKVHFLQEIYADYMVYEVHRREGGRELYRRNYTVKTNGEIDFTGEPEEVRKEVEYVTMSEKNRDSVKLNKEDKMKRNDEECAPCIKEKVDALIANKATKWEEDDREFLETLSEEQIDKFEMNKVEKPEDEEEVKRNKEKKKDSPETDASTDKGLTDEEKTVLAFGRKMLKEKREHLVKGVQENTEKGTWSDDELKDMDIEVLEKLHSSVVPDKEENDQVDYSLNSNTKSYKEKPGSLPPPGITEEDKKE